MIVKMVGNIISGQIIGDTAKQLSERFGKIILDRRNLSSTEPDTSISKSLQLEAAVPPSKVSSLSSGEFGMGCNDPTEKTVPKTFHCEIINDHEVIGKEETTFEPIPVVRTVDQEMIQRNYNQIKQDLREVFELELHKMVADPD